MMMTRTFGRGVRSSVSQATLVVSYCIEAKIRARSGSGKKSHCEAKSSIFPAE